MGQVAKHYRHRNRVGAKLKQRRRGQPVWAIEIAERTYHRLHRRYWALLLRGMPNGKATTAVARELVSFIWEAMLEARRRSRQRAA